MTPHFLSSLRDKDVGNDKAFTPCTVADPLREADGHTEPLRGGGGECFLGRVGQAKRGPTNNKKSWWGCASLDPPYFLDFLDRCFLLALSLDKLEE